MNDESNPYRSPSPSDGPPLLVSTNWDSLQVTVLKRSLAYRRLRITGAIEAIVQYNGRGFGWESVVVNDQLALRAPNMHLNPFSSLVPHLAFDILASGVRIPATIDVRGIVFLRAFRLSMGNRVVYSEGSW